jgi:hypothetical protein
MSGNTENNRDKQQIVAAEIFRGAPSNRPMPWGLRRKAAGAILWIKSIAELGPLMHYPKPLSRQGAPGGRLDPSAQEFALPKRETPLSCNTYRGVP